MFSPFDSEIPVKNLCQQQPLSFFNNMHAQFGRFCMLQFYLGSVQHLPLPRIGGNATVQIFNSSESCDQNKGQDGNDAHHPEDCFQSGSPEIV